MLDLNGYTDLSFEIPGKWFYWGLAMRVLLLPNKCLQCSLQLDVSLNHE